MVTPVTGDWNCGRAIDAEVYEFKDNYYLYFATRDKDFKIQIQGVAVAPGNTDFNREDWTQAVDAPILVPELAWEGECIEAADFILKANPDLFEGFQPNKLLQKLEFFTPNTAELYS